MLIEKNIIFAYILKWKIEETLLFSWTVWKSDNVLKDPTIQTFTITQDADYCTHYLSTVIALQYKDEGSY